LKSLIMTTAALVISTTATMAAADEASYSPPRATHAAPSSASVARKQARGEDRLLSRNVRKAIAKGGDVAMSRLTITARSGIVTLSGSVPDNEQVSRATERAQSVAGVTEVSSHLTLDMPGH
jgi:osmotically-inducible protein OsmY